MTGAYEGVLRPLAFRADPERVHGQTLRLLAAAGRVRPAVRAAVALADRHRAPVTVAGVRFPGRVGLAAGMDKDGVALPAWAALGFGHVEVGTVTAVPQPGNERPRLFRLPASRAVVNRMGFNNGGAAALAGRLAALRARDALAGLRVGVSVGKTRAVPLADAVADYLTSLRLVAPHADYVAVNVSSPNTPGLRRLQDADALRALVRALVAASPVPVFVKIAPDLSPGALDEVLEVCVAGGVAGLVATNTTLAREGVDPADADRAAEAGGLSGAPLAARARAVVAHVARCTDLPVIGVGGVLTADDGRALLDAGASLLQVYTGLVYRGPALVRELDLLAPAAERRPAP